MTGFFDKEDTFAAYAKLIHNNERVLCSTRIAQAEAALQQMKQDIDRRIEKLHGIYKFLDSKKELYEQLSKDYGATPADVVAKKLQKLKMAIEKLEDKLKSNQPEKIIADLSSKYEELKQTLAQKKALAVQDIRNISPSY